MSPFRASAPITARAGEHFDFAVDDGVATVTLDRPDKLNALTFEAYADLRDLVAELPHRGDARVLVLAGEGRGFCSGGDVEEIIGELQKMEAAELLEFTRMTGRHGQGAARVPAAGDRRDQRRRRRAPGPSSRWPATSACWRARPRSRSSSRASGLAGADMGSAYLLPRHRRPRAARRELLMLGDKVDAEEALASASATSSTTTRCATETARARAPPRRRPGARLLGDQGRCSPASRTWTSPASIELEAMTQALLMQSHDHGEFYAAWTEGRAPEWSGR